MDRILVDHSGYDLLNIGDIAQLQVCVRRLAALWPDASIGVIAHDPDRLREYCQGTSFVDTVIARSALARRLPRWGRFAAMQVYKVVVPLGPWRPGSPAGPWPERVDLLRAVREADLVVASGGGYLNDDWWWHGSGVLSVIRLAQRLGTPTAFFGQGMGPLGNRWVRHQLRAAARGAAVIGLREGVDSPDVLRGAGLAGDRVTVTGDDALEMAVPAQLPPAGTGIGLNLRVAAYTRLDPSTAAAVRDTVIAAGRDRGAPLIALPVSRYQRPGEPESREDTLHTVGASGADIEVEDIRTAEQLACAVRRCRVVVTSSYHAAVFALANGVMAVCLVASPYYDSKFRGLAGLFPGVCTVVRLDEPAVAERLTAAVDHAWARSDDDRRTAHAMAVDQVLRSRRLYELLRDLVEEGRPRPGQDGEFAHNIL